MTHTLSNSFCITLSCLRILWGKTELKFSSAFSIVIQSYLLTLNDYCRTDIDKLPVEMNEHLASGAWFLGGDALTQLLS